MTAGAAPPSGSIERWAYDLVTTDRLAAKLTPPVPPARFAAPVQPVRRLAAPGRPPELRVAARTARSTPLRKLAAPRHRARLCAVFHHHELQAAELMAWAILAFPDTPEEFRRGLLGICTDEIRHMAMYRAHLCRLGFDLADFRVRDWFWERVAACRTPLQFVALLGIGFEGGNLDHAARFAAAFRTVGDAAGARIHEVVGSEEIGHVRFAVRWFREWTGGVDFGRWCAELVPPLSPDLLRGAVLDLPARREAGLPAAFLAALDARR